MYIDNRITLKVKEEVKIKWDAVKSELKLRTHNELMIFLIDKFKNEIKK